MAFDAARPPPQNPWRKQIIIPLLSQTEGKRRGATPSPGGCLSKGMRGSRACYWDSHRARVEVTQTNERSGLRAANRPILDAPCQMDGGRGLYTAELLGKFFPVLQQPCSGRPVVWANLFDQRPERARMIRAFQMHQFMPEHVVAHLWRH